jgi:hypothetical protein
VTIAATTLEAPSRRPGRSTLAVLAGLIVVAVLSTGTDQVMQALGIYPPNGEPLRDSGLFALALSYRIAYQILGGYVTARLAPHKAWRHVWILALVGLALATLGVISSAAGDLGPLWYPIVLALSAVPCVGLGGRLAQRMS